MRIGHNVPALMTHLNLRRNDRFITASMQRLSTGVRINSAREDAAGLAIANKLGYQFSGLERASANSTHGISMIQTAEGALNEIHNMLQRMRELAVQAANDTMTKEDRAKVQNEINDLTDEITASAGRAEFNKIRLLNGEAARVNSTWFSGQLNKIIATATYISQNVPPGTLQYTIRQVGLPAEVIGATAIQPDHTVEDRQTKGAVMGTIDPGEFPLDRTTSLTINGHVLVIRGQDHPSGPDNAADFQNILLRAFLGPNPDPRNWPGGMPLTLPAQPIPEPGVPEMTLPASPGQLLDPAFDPTNPASFPNHPLFTNPLDPNNPPVIPGSANDIFYRGVIGIIAPQESVLDFARLVDDGDIVIRSGHANDLTNPDRRINLETDNSRFFTHALQMHNAEDLIESTATPAQVGGSIQNAFTDTPNPVAAQAGRMVITGPTGATVEIDFAAGDLLVDVLAQIHALSPTSAPPLPPGVRQLDVGPRTFAFETIANGSDQTMSIRMESPAGTPGTPESTELAIQFGVVAAHSTGTSGEGSRVQGIGHDGTGRITINGIQINIGPNDTYATIKAEIVRISGYGHFTFQEVDTVLSRDLPVGTSTLVNNVTNAVNGVSTTVLLTSNAAGSNQRVEVEGNPWLLSFFGLQPSYSRGTDAVVDAHMVDPRGNPIRDFNASIAVVADGNQVNILSSHGAVVHKNLQVRPNENTASHRVPREIFTADSTATNLISYQPRRFEAQPIFFAHGDAATPVPDHHNNGPGGATFRGIPQMMENPAYVPGSPLLIPNPVDPTLPQVLNPAGTPFIQAPAPNAWLVPPLMCNCGQNAIAGAEATPAKDLELRIESFGPIKLQIGANHNQNMDVQIPRVSAETLRLVEIRGGNMVRLLSYTTVEGATLAIDQTDRAIQMVSGIRARLGAYQNRLESTVRNLDTASLNTESARSRIQDTDMAREMTHFSTRNVMYQSGLAILGQANQRPQMILSLLQ